MLRSFDWFIARMYFAYSACKHNKTNAPRVQVGSVKFHFDLQSEFQITSVSIGPRHLIPKEGHWRYP